MQHDAVQRKHFHNSMFNGFDFDGTMLRIGSMNMLLHGVESPDILLLFERNSLLKERNDLERRLGGARANVSRLNARRVTELFPDGPGKPMT